MSPVVLSQRATNLMECMDDPQCDPVKLRNTYAQFGAINRQVSGWDRIYRQYLRPVMQRTGHTTLLDIGFGGGDIPRLLHAWAKRDGLRLDITAIDPDPRAEVYVRTQGFPAEVTFRAERSTALLERGERFDLVVSNHLLHHLSDTQVQRLCRECEGLARRLVIHNDIARGDLAYLAFGLTRPFFRHSFIAVDGLRSIRRSYTPAELRAVAPEGWTVRRMFPYRNLLIYQAS
jgi:2-polyprenyl-3-methyl-5-hydroxy-6-metoxy-1,4-benzoquinol methylase